MWIKNVSLSNGNHQEGQSNPYERIDLSLVFVKHQRQKVKAKCNKTNGQKHTKETNQVKIYIENGEKI